MDSLKLIREVNSARAAEWHEGIEWTLADWSNAMVGEAGECANKVKKIRRLETGANSRYSEQERGPLVAAAVAEIADTFIYLDLLLEQLDPSLSMYDVVRAKFNATSEEFGFAHRLPDLEAPADDDPGCKVCGRDNRNGTHAALETFGHLNHSFQP